MYSKNNNICQPILQSSPEEIQDILQTALQRYRELYPNWEISTISIEKGHNRVEQLDNIIALLEKIK